MDEAQENPNQYGMAPDNDLYAVNPMSVITQWEKHVADITGQLMLSRAAVDELRDRVKALMQELEFERERYNGKVTDLAAQEAFAVDQQMLLDRYKAMHGDLPPEPTEESLTEAAAEAVVTDIAQNGVGEVAHIDTRDLTPRHRPTGKTSKT